MKKIKKILFCTIITMALVMSLGITAFAATSGGTFPYAGKTIHGELNVTWNSLKKDTGYAKTYVTTVYGNYPLGAYINAYDTSGYLKKSASKVGTVNVSTPKISCNASKFSSVHNIQDKNNVPKKSINLSISSNN